MIEEPNYYFDKIINPNQAQLVFIKNVVKITHREIVNQKEWYKKLCGFTPVPNRYSNIF